MIFQSKSIHCQDCGANFTFSAVEQEYFQSKGFVGEPEHYPSCRQARKERQGGEGHPNGDSVPRSQYQVFSATCARCGKSTEVPFEPRKGRPVYCGDCYTAIRVNR